MEIEEARQRKFEEMQSRHATQQAQASREAEAEAQIEALLRKLLSTEAKARLGNVKLVNRELYLRAVQGIVAGYQAGRVRGKLGEEDLKSLLGELSAKREPAITRK